MKKNVIIKMSIFILLTICFVILIKYYSNSLSNQHPNDRNFQNSLIYVSKSTYQDVTEKSFPVETNGILKIQTDFANIKIESWDKNEVKVIIKKEGDEENFKYYNVTFSGTPQKVEINGKFERSFWSWGNLKVNYIIKVPHSFNHDIDNSAGDVELREVNGVVKISSSAGNITLSDITGDVNINTSAGNMDLKSVDGYIRASTSAGNIKVTPTNENKGIDLESSAGNVKLNISENTKADLDCSTSIGNVHLNIHEGFSGNKDGNSINGTLNGGGNRIKLKTSIGNISISSIKR